MAQLMSNVQVEYPLQSYTRSPCLDLQGHDLPHSITLSARTDALGADYRNLEHPVDVFWKVDTTLGCDYLNQIFDGQINLIRRTPLPLRVKTH